MPKAPIKATIGIVYNIPKIESPIPNTIAIVAPKLAPADMPIINGSAMGLRSNPCNTTPELARAVPTSAAAKTRGKRTIKITSWLRIDDGSPIKLPKKGIFWKIILYTSKGEIWIGPTAVQMAIVIKRIMIKRTITIFH